jgi:hypothetical protein
MNYRTGISIAGHYCAFSKEKKVMKTRMSATETMDAKIIERFVPVDPSLI